MNSNLHFVAAGLVLRSMPIQGGRGVFATRCFAAGEVLAAWGGVVLSGEQIHRLPSDELSWVLQIDDDLFQYSPHGQRGLADYINHSCDPNAGLVGQIILRARRIIQPDEQITFDYSMADSHPLLEFPCQCGAAGCRGHVRADDWRRLDMQQAYGEHFSPYLRRRMIPQR